VNNKESVSNKKSLLLALVSGMSANALLSAISVPNFSFSIFPLICLILAIQMMYQLYLTKPLTDDFPMLGLGSFFIGFFGHSAFVKAQHPEVGTNFFSIIVTLLLLLWVGRRLGYLGKNK
jgi:hypothetical protein